MGTGIGELGVGIKPNIHSNYNDTLESFSSAEFLAKKIENFNTHTLRNEHTTLLEEMTKLAKAGFLRLLKSS